MKRILTVCCFVLASFESYGGGDVNGRIFIGKENDLNFEQRNLVFDIGQESIILYYAADSYDYSYAGRRRYCDFAKLRIKINDVWTDLTRYEDIGEIPGHRVHWTINITNLEVGEYPIEVFRWILNTDEMWSGASSTLIITNTLDGGEISVASTYVCPNTPVAFSNVRAPSGGSGIYSYKWCYEYILFKNYYYSSTLSYTINNIISGAQYFRIVTDSHGNVAYSNRIIMSLYSSSSINAGSINTNTPTVCPDVTFSILNTESASGGAGGFSYSWYRYPPGGYNEPLDHTANMYSGTISDAPYYYVRKAIDQCGTTASSVPVLITPKSELSPGTITTDVGTYEKQICSGEMAGEIKNSIPATGDSNIKYYWQIQNANLLSTNYEYITVNGRKVEGLNYTHLDQLVYDKDQKYYFFRREANNGCTSLTAYTREVKITPQLPVTNAGQISIENLSSDNESTTICYGVKPIISSISPMVGNASYKWEYSLLEASGWTPWVEISSDSNSESEESGKFASKIGVTQTIKYRRAITGVCNVGITSNEVIFYVLPQVTAGEIAADTTICNGIIPNKIRNKKDATGGDGLYYQWYSSTNGKDFSSLREEVEKGSTYHFALDENLTQTTYFKRRVIDNCLLDNNGRVAKIIETAPIQITVKPMIQSTDIELETQNICFGTEPFAINTANAQESKADRYQWYQSKEKVNWESINGAVKASFNPGVVRELTYYKRESIFENNGYVCGSSFSNIASVAVYDTLNPGKIGVDQLVIRNDIPDPLDGIPATGKEPLSYQWQILENGIWNDIPRYSQSQNITLGAQTLNEQRYRRQVTDGCGVTKWSNTVIIKCIDDIDGGEISPTSLTVCYGTVVELNSVGMTADGVTFQWQSSSDGINWNDIIIDGKDANYKLAVLSTSYFRRLTTFRDKTIATRSPVFITVIGSNNPPTIKDNWKTAYCENQPVALEVNQNANYSYYWADYNGKKIKDGLKFEIAKLQVDSIVMLVSVDNRNQCEQSKSITIAIDNVKADFRASKTSVNLNDGVIFTNLSVGASKYEWDFGEAEGSKSNTQELRYYFHQPGEHTITLTAESANGCLSEKVMENYITVSEYAGTYPDNGEYPTGVETKENTGFVIYPNPVDDVLYIRYENSAPETAEIFDVKGRLLLKLKITDNPEAINVSSLPAGAYILRLTERNNIKNIKFIKP